MIFINVFLGCLALFGVIFALVIVLDTFLWVKPKLAHRKIKGYDDFTLWKRRVAECGRKWAKRMPTVRLKDERRFVLLDILTKQYKHSSLQGWQYAQLISGLKAIDAEAKIKDFFTDNAIKEVDEGFLIYSEWTSGILENKDADALMQRYIEIIERSTKENGLIEYREGFGNICLVDTLAFVCPILIKYGLYKNDEKWVDLAIKQIETYHSCAYVKEFGLYAHAYDSVKCSPCESIAWGRGTGWYLLGLLSCHRELPDTRKEKEELRLLIKEALENIVRHQKNDGGWCTQLVGQWNYDSSATAIFAYFILCASELLGEQKAYVGYVEKAIRKLMSVTTEKGAIEYCEGDCHGIGKYSTLYTVSPFTQGMTMHLIKEYEKQYGAEING